MDLLGSILNTMDKPPSVSSSDKARIKKHREQIENEKDKQKQQVKQLRQMAEQKINAFVQNNKETRLKFLPMNQLCRNVIRELAEDAGLVSHSFGVEEEDRYTMLFKKESPPCEDELNTLRAGEEWSLDKAEEIGKKRKLEQLQEVEDQKVTEFSKNFKPAHNYKEKYELIIGTEVAKDAARKTETNKQYGFVPSENKKDHRSIEETLADIRKKKQKVKESESSTEKVDA